MHEVLKNIPVPKTLRNWTPNRRKYPFEQMDVGDMFFVPNKKRNTIATHTSTAGKQLKCKFVTRLCHMKEGLEGWEPCEPTDEGAVMGVGVWRVE